MSQTCTQAGPAPPMNCDRIARGVYCVPPAAVATDDGSVVSSPIRESARQSSRHDADKKCVQPAYVSHVAEGGMLGVAAGFHRAASALQPSRAEPPPTPIDLAAWAVDALLVADLQSVAAQSAQSMEAYHAMDMAQVRPASVYRSQGSVLTDSLCADPQHLARERVLRRGPRRGRLGSGHVR